MAEAKRLMYSDQELELIKATFADNDFLLIAIRKLFFGFEITGEERKAIVETFASEQMRDVFRKKVYGLNNPDTPVGQLTDFWLGVEQQVFGQHKDAIYQAVNSKAMVLEMFERAFKLLTNPDGEKVDITYDPKSLIMDDLAVNLLARNLYVKAIETSLAMVKAIAGAKVETLEDTKKRLQQDSAR